MSDGWNHNVHYHEMVLSSVPPNCGRALEVGCGAGLLARRLRERCDEIFAIDLDHDAIERARSAAQGSGTCFIEGDILSHPFAVGSVDLITVVATLHHLPLEPALERFRHLLKPAGVLVVIGLYRRSTLADFACAAVALPISWLLRQLRGNAEVGAPIREPKETLSEIRNTCARLLPGSVLRRRLFFRYSLIWRKP